MARDEGAGAGTVLFAFLLGAVSGAAVALLYTPVTGRETREYLGEKAREGRERANEAAQKGRQVLTQGIANISTQAGYQADWPALFAALTLAILPMLIVYAIFQRRIQAGLTAGALK